MVPPPPELLEEERNARGMEVLPGRRNGSNSRAKFFTTLVEAMGKSRAPAAPQFFEKESETRKLLMAVEAHTDDPYATDIEDVLHHTLEQFQHTVALNIMQQGMNDWQQRTSPYVFAAGEETPWS